MSPVYDFTCRILSQLKRQFALRRRFSEADFTFIRRNKVFILKIEIATARHDVVKLRHNFRRFNQARHGIQVAGFRQPTGLPVIKQRIPLVPHTVIVLHLKPSDQGKWAGNVCPCRADLKRAEIFQQSGIASGIDDTVILPHQHAVAVAAHQRNGCRGMRLNRRAAARAVGFEEWGV